MYCAINIQHCMNYLMYCAILLIVKGLLKQKLVNEHTIYVTNYNNNNNIDKL